MIRFAIKEDARQIIDLFDNAYNGNYPLKEFTDIDKFNNILDDNTHIVLVSVNELKSGDEQIDGIFVGVINHEHKNFEMGRLVLKENYTSVKVLPELFDNVMKTGFLRELDYAWTSTRSKGPMRFCDRRMEMNGYIARHKVGDARENHILHIALNPNIKNKVILPNNAEQYSWYCNDLVSKIRSNIKYDVGTYPDDIIAGKKYPSAVEFNNHKIFFDTHSIDKSTLIGKVIPKSNEITLANIIHAVSDSGILMRTEYVELDVLADKCSFIKKISESGFKISAYIPGGFYDGKNRYDTLKLIKVCGAEPQSLDNVIGERINYINDNFR